MIKSYWLSSCAAASTDLRASSALVTQCPAVIDNDKQIRVLDIVHLLNDTTPYSAKKDVVESDLFRYVFADYDMAEFIKSINTGREQR